ncbi:acetate--CoA ligase [Peristeroidobacter soli]|uniref:acetate--CoA ligase n=1 Tax=Peristeroidobacter soli TaxID=2497877 RepID=UPI001C3762C8|nr:acetate--CoA ligase [Peristeroidobacter soli]
MQPAKTTLARFSPIEKSLRTVRAANLWDYEAMCRHFSWDQLRADLFDRSDDKMNIAMVAIDGHAKLTPNKPAVRFVDAEFTRTELTYGELLRSANRFANLLRLVAIEPGAVVASLLGRCPELYSTVLGTLKCGAIFAPLFAAFGPEPIRSRLELAGARVLVTTQHLYERKVAPIRSTLPTLRHIFIVREVAEGELPHGTQDLTQAMSGLSETFETVPLSADTPALLHFTSGTTGKPKGVVHVHDAIVAHHASARLALDLHPQDVFWCTADPGWVTGISYGVLAPLSCGVTLLVDREELDVERWYRLLAENEVNVWYTAPTAIRMLMKAGLEPVKRHTYPALRLIASVGEPLNPEAVMWGMGAFGMPVHDTWWQTETGAIMIANFLSQTVWPGAMGRPMPGVHAEIGRRRDDGTVEILAPNEVGEIVLRPGWPSMFSGYLNNEQRYQESFTNGWYFSGDQAYRDEHGYFWFIGRTDDVIKSSGHLISPFEVECALNLHPAVMQSAVIGLPDPVAGQVVQAIVELRPDYAGDDELRRSIMAHARRSLGAAIAPRGIDFVVSLPRTRSGKIMRRLLRVRALGLPEGDLSTLEPSA